jgi:protein ImuB
MNASSRRRILALWLPRLPTDRLQRRAQPSGDKKPLVLTAKVDNALRLSAVDARAAKLGLSAGMALADARAMIPALDVIAADEAADRKLLERIADWCERFSPLVALDPPHGLFFDVTGATHLFGGERVMLESVRRAIAAQGFSICLALAGTASAARALAFYANGTIVEQGLDAQSVAPLPVAGLMVDQTIVHGLRRAGLKIIGDVAGRARHELAARFGGAFVTQLDRTLGREDEPISPRHPLPDCMAERRFAEPVVTDDVVADTIHALAESIAGLLEKRGEGARQLEAAFFRADGQMRRIAIAMARPTRDPAVAARLFHEKLDALANPLDPGFGFDLIRLSAVTTEPLNPQATSFDSRENEKKDIDFLIDRLSARFGATRVLRFQPQDTHIPEAASVALPAQSCAAAAWTPLRVAAEAPRRPLRLFTKPEPVEVMAEVPDGPPLRFRWRRVQHAVAFAEGPERIAMEWWRTQASMPTRDYFRIEDDQGRRFWLYRDGLYDRETSAPRWFMHGVFA